MLSKHTNIQATSDNTVYYLFEIQALNTTLGVMNTTVTNWKLANRSYALENPTSPAEEFFE